MKKSLHFLILVGCVGFIFAAVYVHLFKGAPLSLLLLAILFFGTGVVVELIALTTRPVGWVIDRKQLTRGQSIALGISGLIFSLCGLWIALQDRIHALVKAFIIIVCVCFMAIVLTSLRKRIR